MWWRCGPNWSSASWNCLCPQRKEPPMPQHRTLTQDQTTCLLDALRAYQQAENVTYAELARRWASSDSTLTAYARSKPGFLAIRSTAVRIAHGLGRPLGDL